MNRRADGTIRVCHIVHSPRIGGAETIVAALQAGAMPEIDYRVAVLTKRSDLSGDNLAIAEPDGFGAGLNNLLTALPILRWVAASHAEVVVASLWRSVLIGVLAKLLTPSRRLVVFVHSTRYKNRLDALSHWLGLKLADAVFVDSEATGRTLPNGLRAHVHVIHPMVPQAVHPTCQKTSKELRQIELIFWGRLAAEKQLDEAVRTVAALNEDTSAQLTLIGPDDGQWNGLSVLADRLGIGDKVRWLGPQPHHAIGNFAQSADFFIQPSAFEGLGMAAFEAMGFGLVPVVTAVGEIANYAKDGVNAIYIAGAARTAQKIAAVWRDQETYTRLSTAAAESTSRPNSLHESFVAACSRTVGDLAPTVSGGERDT